MLHQSYESDQPHEVLKTSDNYVLLVDLTYVTLERARGPHRELLVPAKEEDIARDGAVFRYEPEQNIKYLPKDYVSRPFEMQPLLPDGRQLYIAFEPRYDHPKNEHWIVEYVGLDFLHKANAQDFRNPRGYFKYKPCSIDSIDGRSPDLEFLGRTMEDEMMSRLTAWKADEYVHIYPIHRMLPRDPEEFWKALGFLDGPPSFDELEKKANSFPKKD